MSSNPSRGSICLVASECTKWKNVTPSFSAISCIACDSFHVSSAEFLPSIGFITGIPVSAAFLPSSDILYPLLTTPHTSLGYESGKSCTTPSSSA